MADTIGSEIRAQRRRLDLTQAQLAEAVSVSRVTVADWERDKSVPTEENFEKLAELFGVEVPQLRYPQPESSGGVPSMVAEGRVSFGRDTPARSRLSPKVYEVVYGYIERMKRARCSEEQIAEAERIMTDTAYSQLYSRSRREKTEEDQIMDIHAAWKFIAEVIERTGGKNL